MAAEPTDRAGSGFHLGTTAMTGAQALISSLVGAGIEVCFMNPGTSEMHFVHALDAVPRMRGVLGLFEGVVTGAADGYARISGQPAAVLLHLGPGLSNGMANLHNARRAHTPVVCIVGAHATGHVRFDAPLQSDIETVARTVSGWVHTAGQTRNLGQDAMRAVAASFGDGGQIATLVLPADVSWAKSGTVAGPRPVARLATVDDASVTAAADILRGPGLSLLLLGGSALTEHGLKAASRIAAVTGARLLAERFPARMECGAGLPSVSRLAYRPEQADAQLAGTAQLILVGAQSPVSFFAYPGRASDLVPAGCRVTQLADWTQDAEGALEQVAADLASLASPVLAPANTGPAAPGPITAQSLAAAVAATLPEDAIVVEEANTLGIALPAALAGAARHSLLTVTGGAIGQGLPVATGAAVAAPHRRVVCIESDGSALYTIQALWTQAREKLDITTILLNNSAYAILQMELARVGAGPLGDRAARMLSLDNPTPNFAEISRGLGVPAIRVRTAERLQDELSRAHGSPGPHLIEAMVPPIA